MYELIFGFSLIYFIQFCLLKSSLLPHQSSDWDFFLKAGQLGNRHVLAPLVPRTRHLGGGGVHVTGLEQEMYFSRRIFNDKLDYVAMDVERCAWARFRKLYGSRSERGLTYPLSPWCQLEFQRLYLLIPSPSLKYDGFSPLSVDFLSFTKPLVWFRGASDVRNTWQDKDIERVYFQYKKKLVNVWLNNKQKWMK